MRPGRREPRTPCEERGAERGACGATLVDSLFRSEDAILLGSESAWTGRARCGGAIELRRGLPALLDRQGPSPCVLLQRFTWHENFFERRLHHFAPPLAARSDRAGERRARRARRHLPRTSRSRGLWRASNLPCIQVALHHSPGSVQVVPGIPGRLRITFCEHQRLREGRGPRRASGTRDRGGKVELAPGRKRALRRGGRRSCAAEGEKQRRRQVPLGRLGNVAGRSGHLRAGRTRQDTGWDERSRCPCLK